MSHRMSLWMKHALRSPERTGTRSFLSDSMRHDKLVAVRRLRKSVEESERRGRTLSTNEMEDIVEAHSGLEKPRRLLTHVRTYKDHYGVPPTLKMWQTVYVAFVRDGDIYGFIEAFRIHSTLSPPCGQTMALVVSVLSRYGQLQELDRLCHDGIDGKIPTNTIFFEEVACAYAEARNVDACLKVLDFMSSRGTKTPSHVYRVLLEAFEEMNDLNQAESVLELARKRGVPTKSAGLQSLMKMYLRRKHFGAFKELVSDVGEKTWSLQKSELYEAGCFEQARDVYLRARDEKIDLTHGVNEAILNVYARLGDVHHVRNVLKTLTETLTPAYLDALITAYCASGNLKAAIRTYEGSLKTFGVETERSSQDALISGLTKDNGQEGLDAASRIFDRWTRSRPFKRPDAVTASIMIDGYARHNMVGEILAVQEFLRSRQMHPTPDLFSSLAAVYARLRRLAEARSTLSEMKRYGVPPNRSSYWVCSAGTRRHWHPSTTAKLKPGHLELLRDGKAGIRPGLAGLRVARFRDARGGKA
ncbi:hypothetical protein NDN08_000028 [Rhodosorus marinus]|uniref:Pentatricopeptide repeat-containing protein-mitochondrial domain-containing protein n=1 Tax=Rhodosorus marinus TaxID=101924 RepID=A0AAV8UHP2_9RHOD|nr:hypothetical protein NDN08_000028 [Rhodosorus marinus]